MVRGQLSTSAQERLNVSNIEVLAEQYKTLQLLLKRYTDAKKKERQIVRECRAKVKELRTSLLQMSETLPIKTCIDIGTEQFAVFKTVVRNVYEVRPIEKNTLGSGEGIPTTNETQEEGTQKQTEESTTTDGTITDEKKEESTNTDEKKEGETEQPTEERVLVSQHRSFVIRMKKDVDNPVKDVLEKHILKHLVKTLTM